MMMVFLGNFSMSFGLAANLAVSMTKTCCLLMGWFFALTMAWNRLGVIVAFGSTTVGEELVRVVASSVHDSQVAVILATHGEATRLARICELVHANLVSQGEARDGSAIDLGRPEPLEVVLDGLRHLCLDVALDLVRRHLSFLRGLCLLGIEVLHQQPSRVSSRGHQSSAIHHSALFRPDETQNKA